MQSTLPSADPSRASSPTIQALGEALTKKTTPTTVDLLPTTAQFQPVTTATPPVDAPTQVPSQIASGRASPEEASGAQEEEEPRETAPVTAAEAPPDTTLELSPTPPVLSHLISESGLSNARPFVMDLIVIGAQASLGADPAKAATTLAAQAHTDITSLLGYDVPFTYFHAYFQHADGDQVPTDRFVLSVPGPLKDLFQRLILKEHKLLFTGDDKGNKYKLAYSGEHKKTARTLLDTEQDENAWCILHVSRDCPLSRTELYMCTHDILKQHDMELVEFEQQQDKQNMVGMPSYRILYRLPNLPKSGHVNLSKLKSFPLYDNDGETADIGKIWFKGECVSLVFNQRVCMKCFKGEELCTGHVEHYGKGKGKGKGAGKGGKGNSSAAAMRVAKKARTDYSFP